MIKLVIENAGFLKSAPEPGKRKIVDIVLGSSIHYDFYIVEDLAGRTIKKSQYAADEKIDTVVHWPSLYAYGNITEPRAATLINFLTNVKKQSWPHAPK